MLQRPNQANETTPLAKCSTAMEHASGPRATIVATVLRTVTLAGLYISVSAGMILFNKFLMHEGRFPYATILTTLHMSNSVLMSTCMLWLCPSLFPTIHLIVGSKNSSKRLREILEGMLPFTLIALCGAMALVAGNSAYKYSSVAFLQMLKESHIVFIYCMMLMVGLDKLNFRTVAILLFVAASAAVAVCEDMVFSVHGFMLQTVAGLCGSSQIVLTNLLMSRPTGHRLDPMTMVLCTAPWMLCFLIPAAVYNWDSNVSVQARLWWPEICANMAIAFLLQVVTAMTIQQLSAVGHSLASVLKDVCIVVAAGLVLRENIARIQICGFICTICGIALYSTCKLFPDIKLCPSRCFGKAEAKDGSAA
mmetsp:Transcript_22150/g.40739  ORF Transcript_22150/g.40739 Transcript_22150/m.40739 type:complete len:364 (-) Transcript_22150:117-1208(-)